MPPTGSTAKALQMEHFSLSSHHEVIFGKNILTRRAACTVKPENRE